MEDPKIQLLEPVAEEITLPPTQDDLPYDDGMPMETNYHVRQMLLLLESLQYHYMATKQRAFVGGNMFVYFSLEQTRKQDFRGPDLFVVLDVSPHMRKSWVVWDEGKGPDVVIELLSESTAEVDKGEKKEIYQNKLRVPEYFWYDPLNGELAGFALREGKYEPILPDEQGRLISRVLNLALNPVWQGAYLNEPWRWLRWETVDGTLLPFGEELARHAQQQADAEKHAADAAQQEAETARQEADTARQEADTAKQAAHAAEEKAKTAEERAAELAELLARYRDRFGELPK